MLPQRLGPLSSRLRSLLLLSALSLVSGACDPEAARLGAAPGEARHWCAEYRDATAQLESGEAFPIPPARPGLSGTCICLDGKEDALRQVQQERWLARAEVEPQWDRFVEEMRRRAEDTCNFVALTEWEHQLWFTSCAQATEMAIPFRDNQGGAC